MTPTSVATPAADLARLEENQVRCGVPLAAFTSLKVGGPAEFFCRVRGPAELARCLDAAFGQGLSGRVLGGGSNVLVSDRGIRGLVIVNHARGYSAEEHDGTVMVRCQSGTPLAGLARAAAARGWQGLEFACGIPGTVGGAVAGNAGAYGGCMADVVRRVAVWTPGGVQEWRAEDLAFDYRDTRLKGRHDVVVLVADLALQIGDRAAGMARAAANEARRRASQPSHRSVGSVFKNPGDDYAGRLIEAVGLKGTRRGGAEISRVHGNFFINRGGATAADILDLIALARERVWQASGRRLELEILPVGEWTPEELKLLHS